MDTLAQEASLGSVDVIGANASVKNGTKHKDVGWRSLLRAQYWRIPLILSCVLLAIAPYSYPTFHVLAELFSVCIAFTLFALAWNISTFSSKNSIILLAAGYFWVACFDLLHLLSFKGMGVGLLPNQGMETTVEFWLAGRYSEALLLLSTLVFYRRKINRTYIFLGFAAAWCAITAAVFSEILPRTFIEGQGLTPFKIVSEYVIIAILCVAFYLARKKGHVVYGADSSAIAAAIGFTVLAEFSFTLYIDFFGLPNLLGHLLKILSFWMVFQAVILSNIRRPYVDVMKLRSAIEQTPSMIIVGNPDGSIRYTNPTFQKITGFSAQDYKSCPNHIIPENSVDTRDETSHIWNLINQGKTWHGRMRNVKKDNSKYWEYASIKGLLDYDGYLESIIASKDDITNRTIVNEYLFDHENAITKTLLGAVGTVERLLRERDPYTSHHSEKVAELSVHFAKKLGLPAEQIESIRLASVIHDIGKIKVPMEILNKPGKLTDDEMAIVKTHPVVGYEAIKSIPFPWDVPNIVLSHHERIDGTGYPNALKGDEIPLEAQIIAVADVIEAVTSHRPYRPSLGVDKAEEILKEGSGTAFNADIVVIALAAIKDGNVSRMLSS